MARRIDKITIRVVVRLDARDSSIKAITAKCRKESVRFVMYRSSHPVE